MLTPAYDRLAPYYDRLAGWIFGQHLDRLARSTLTGIRPGGKVLIAGGGTGRVLECLPPVRADFVDVSEKMIRQARQRKHAGLSVRFINRNILDWHEEGYDVVLCHFFLSQFTTGEAQLVLRHLQGRLRPQGLLLFADFLPPQRLADRLLMQLMLLFFRLTIGIRHRQLPDYSTLFRRCGFEVLRAWQAGRKNIEAMVLQAVRQPSAPARRAHRRPENNPARFQTG